MKTLLSGTLTVVVTAFSLTAAGCTDQTVTGTTAAPPTASFDGGATFGSGNYVSVDGLQNTTAADSVSAARGGGATFGSGN